MLTQESIKKFTNVVSKVDTYAEKNNLTAKKACEKLNIKPFDYYTFKSKLKRAATPKVVTYSAKTKKIGATKKRLQQSNSLTVIIGSPDEVMMVLKGLQS